MTKSPASKQRLNFEPNSNWNKQFAILKRNVSLPSSWWRVEFFRVKKFGFFKFAKWASSKMENLRLKIHLPTASRRAYGTRHTACSAQQSPAIFGARWRWRGISNRFQASNFASNFGWKTYSQEFFCFDAITVLFLPVAHIFCKSEIDLHLFFFRIAGILSCHSNF